MKKTIEWHYKDLVLKKYTEIINGLAKQDQKTIKTDRILSYLIARIAKLEVNFDLAAQMLDQQQKLIQSKPLKKNKYKYIFTKTETD